VLKSYLEKQPLILGVEQWKIREKRFASGCPRNGIQHLKNCGFVTAVTASQSSTGQRAAYHMVE